MSAPIVGSHANVGSPETSKSMEGLSGLYQEIIVEHARTPRCKGRPSVCRFCQDGKNPLCGDHITIFCSVDESSGDKKPRLRLGFEGSGCTISQASASMMCDAVQSKTVEQARELIAQAEGIYTGKLKVQDPDDVELDFEALAGVARFPVRVKCAALAWKSLELLLNEHFDAQGAPKATALGCGSSNCANSRRLRVVSTEAN